MCCLVDFELKRELESLRVWKTGRPRWPSPRVHIWREAWQRCGQGSAARFINFHFRLWSFFGRCFHHLEGFSCLDEDRAGSVGATVYRKSGYIREILMEHPMIDWPSNLSQSVDSSTAFSIFCQVSLIIYKTAEDFFQQNKLNVSFRSLLNMLRR